jgi:hypothetical protein
MSHVVLLLLSHLSVIAASERVSEGVSECGGGMVLRVHAGDLILEDGTRQHVGRYTSQLQAAVITALYPEVVNSRDIASTTFFNSDKLRYLDLSGGEYLADHTLMLPSLFVLRLDTYDDVTSISIAPNASFVTVDDVIPPGLVAMYGVSYSAVIGGTFDARANASYEAIHIENGGHNSVRRVVVKASVFEAWKSMITVRGGTRHEVAHSTVDGNYLAGRCIWTIATSSALVHDNTIQHCIGHALDFDAYTSGSAAWNNLIQDTGTEDSYGQGIFVEETASGNFIFNNTLRRNLNGIAVYSLDVGPVTGNIIANNLVEDSLVRGFSSGGGNGDSTKHAEKNIFVSNTARNNVKGDFMVAHGAVVGDYWVSNVAGDGDEIVWDGADPQSSANVSVFEP